MDFTEDLRNMRIPREGELEIIVQDHETGEIIYRDTGHNQLQDWARQAFAYQASGRLFCSWGNHGDPVSDIGPFNQLPYSISHYMDGRDGSLSTDIIRSSPWTYSESLAGLVQVRRINTGVDDDLAVPNSGDPLYPFFPTKMRFGTGGLDADQNPKVGVSTAATDLQATEMSFPFVLVDRTRSLNSHISLSSSATSASNLTNNKVTYSCKLPGGNPDYPYNNLVISEAGLYCDAAMIVGGSDVYQRTGIMIAYRTFYGITKNESIDITFNWSLVL